jgi:hypothetical protein
MLSISLFHQNKHQLTYICRLNNPYEKSKTKLLKIKMQRAKNLSTNNVSQVALSFFLLTSSFWEVPPD